MMWCKQHVFVCLVVMMFTSCSTTRKSIGREGVNDGCQFVCLDNEIAGLQFSDNHNSLKNYIEFGAGLAAIHANDDDLVDIVAIGHHEVSVFINLGDFKFVREPLNMGIDFQPFSLSVMVLDFNQDGKDDIILSGLKLDEKGVVYTLYEQVNGRFSMYQTIDIPLSKGGLRLPFAMNFLDIEGDGDWDILTSSWELNLHSFTPIQEFESADSLHSSRFVFINEGERFTIHSFSDYGLDFVDVREYSTALLTGDINRDGRTDVYMTNDYNIPDIMWLANDSNGFNYCLPSVMSYYSMGGEIADVNGDMLPDLYVPDMRPIDYVSQMTLHYEKPHSWSQLGADTAQNIAKQNVRNTLNLNMGQAMFNEVAELTNSDKTNWTWGIRAEDFNNDGKLDILTASGTPVEYMGLKDYPRLTDDLSGMSALQRDSIVNAMVESSKDYNSYLQQDPYALTFEDLSELQCNCKPTHSFGLITADFNQDGHLDYATRDADGQLGLMRNVGSSNSWVQIIPYKSNGQLAYYAQIEVYTKQGQYLRELSPMRGMSSTSEALLHIGLGTASTIDSVRIFWQDQTLDVFYDLPINKRHLLSQSTSIASVVHNNAIDTNFMRVEVLETSFNKDVDLPMINETYLDPLLPKDMANEFPAIATGDINNDGYIDLVIGRRQNTPAQIYYGNETMMYSDAEHITPFNKDEVIDGEVLLFDIDHDELLDILLIAYDGLFKGEPSRSALLHNTKDGFQEIDIGLIDDLPASTAATAYWSKELDVWEIFIGGRHSGRDYPSSPPSRLIHVSKDSIVDVSSSLLPNNGMLGMISEARWSDANQDGIKDLWLIGELNVLQLWLRTTSGFERASLGALDSLWGFWETMEFLDIDSDGDEDILLGNVGLNTRWSASHANPIRYYWDDFDQNGFKELVTTYSVDKIEYLTKDLTVLSSRINGLNDRYAYHLDFAQAPFPTMFNFSSSDSIDWKEEVTCMASLVVKNQGNGIYQVDSMPWEAQWAPIRGIQSIDVDWDGDLDIMVVGNRKRNETERGDYLSLKSNFWINDGSGSFTAAPNQLSWPLLHKEALTIKHLEGNRVVIAGPEIGVELLELNYP